MENFLNIIIVGAFLSFVMQAVKDKLGMNSLGIKAITIGLSVIMGVVYVYLQQTDMLETVSGVLAAASTVYALILKKDSN